MQVRDIGGETVTIEIDKRVFQRTLEEIDRLYLYLVQQAPHAVVPPVVKSKDLGFLRAEIQLFLSRLSGHSVLRDTQGFKDFVDSKFQFVYTQSLRKTKSLFSFSQDKSLFSFGSNSVQDIDVFFDDARSEIGHFITAMRTIGKTNERLAGLLTLVVEHLSLVSTRYIALPQDDPQFNRAIRKLVKVHDAEEEFTSAHVHLLTRAGLLEQYDQACKSTMKKIIAMERLKSSSSLKQEKVDKLIQELNECKKQESEIKDNFKSASDTTKREIARYRQERIHDLKQWMDEYVARQIEICQKMHDAWEYLL